MTFASHIERDTRGAYGVGVHTMHTDSRRARRSTTSAMTTGESNTATRTRVTITSYYDDDAPATQSYYDAIAT
jgi:hypothetical protein